MNSMFGTALASNAETSRVIDGEPKAENQLDTAWAVLDAANDLGDDATVAACRRVIDASFYQTPALAADLLIIFNYFR